MLNKAGGVGVWHRAESQVVHLDLGFHLFNKFQEFLLSVCEWLGGGRALGDWGQFVCCPLFAGFRGASHLCVAIIGWERWVGGGEGGLIAMEINW